MIQNSYMPGSLVALGLKDYLTEYLETELDLLKAIHLSRTNTKTEDRSYGYDGKLGRLFGENILPAPKFKTSEVTINTEVYAITIKIGYDQHMFYSEPSFMFDTFQDWTMAKKVTVQVRIQTAMKKHFQNSSDTVDPGILFPKLNMRGRFNVVVSNNSGQSGRSALLTMEETRIVINECVRKSRAFNLMM